MRRPLFLLFILISALIPVRSQGAARLTYLVDEKPQAIRWQPRSFPITYAVSNQTTGSLPGGAESIQKGFDAWSSISACGVKFAVPRHVGAIAAGQDGVNLVTTNDTLFSHGGFLAFTTTWFSDAGEITEADIQIDPELVKQGFSVEALVQHEVGHFLGLDHSAIVSATMYPFVGKSEALPLETDDFLAIGRVYPGDGPASAASLRGQVLRNSAPVFGAHVVAVNESGIAIASELTDAAGRFEFARIAAGRYRIYAEPLDGPVEPMHLSGVWRQASKDAFRTTAVPDVVSVTESSANEIRIDVDTLPVSLNPKWIGVFAPGSPEIRLATTPSAIQRGRTVSVAVGGEGFVSGMTTFEIIGIKRVSEFSYGASFMWADFEIPATAAPGSLVLRVTSGNETAMLTGALRITTSAGPGRSRAVRRG